MGIHLCKKQKDSFNNNEKPDRIILKIESAIGDYFGFKYRDEIAKRLGKLIPKM
jgi:hypothetical protein